MRKKTQGDWKMPKTWKGKMEAVVAGAVDYDDAEPLVMECAAIVDRAVETVRKQKPAATEHKGMDITPAWSDVMPYMVGKLMEWCGREGKLSDSQERMLKEIVHCGEIADAYLAGNFNEAA
jgi:hypothetical protein